MNRRQLLSTAAAAGLVLAPAAQAQSARTPAQARTRSRPAVKPPVAPKRPKRTEQLGRTRIDDYAWMKDDDWQKVMRDPKVLRADIRTHLQAENAYTAAMLKSTEPLQAQLFEEMKARIKEDDASVPTSDGPWEYYSRYEKGAQHPVYARRRLQASGQGAEQVLIDSDALAKGKAYYDIGAASHSPDHALYAYAEDAQGSEYYTIRMKDLASGELLADPVESSTGDFTFSPDNRFVFWTFRDENGRSRRIFRRPVRGTRRRTTCWSTKSPTKACSSASRAAPTTSSSSSLPAIRRPARRSSSPPRTSRPSRGVGRAAQDGRALRTDHWGDRWVIRTNADGAVDFKLVTAPTDNPAKSAWTDWIAHEPGTFIVGFQPYAHHLARLERVNANNRLVITRREGLEDHEVTFPEPAYALGLEGGYEYETPLTRFVYQSPTTPRQWFDYEMNTRERSLRKTQEIPPATTPPGTRPAGFSPARPTARRFPSPC
jgi:oligopeptidase B